MTEKAIKKIKIGIFVALGLIIAAILWFSFTTTVSQGHVGVEFNKAKNGVQDHTLDEGLHFVNPLSKITEYPVSTETVKYDMSLPTGDTKTIAMPISFDYHNETAKTPDIYREWRGQKPAALEDGYLRRTMLGIASEVTSKYTILELNASRGDIQSEILKQFSKKVGEKGFVVTGVNLGTPEYDQQTKDAIQQVVTKQQELKGLELEKEKAVIEAERLKIEAEGNAEKKLIEAQATADSNKKIEESLNDKVLKKMELDARQKHGWVEVQGASGVIVDEKGK